MKKTFISALLLSVAMAFTACNTTTEKTAVNSIPPADKTDATNDFYDNETTHLLPLEMIVVDGETSETFNIDLNALPVHSVIVKETVWTPDSNKFIGAYRYDGPSLYDILNECPLLKKNAEDFKPIIDVYVEVSNDKGEKAVFSWGELFYPIHRHEILIGTSVMHIVPSKTKDYWPLPEEARIVSAADLLTERNISNPTKITIKSLDKYFEVNRELDPMISESIGVYDNEKEVIRITEMPQGDVASYPNIFYGRGRGIHAVTPFEGVILKDVLAAHFETTPEALKTGMFTISAADGYRAAFTFSELMNRNDQSEVLLIDEGEKHGGKFLLYPAADFFSDRSIMSITGIWYTEL
ncbi:MAG: hypothetical protein C0593_11145 [Marinilabiliales bacterium]|nr:MAG: hypothetical protein C0593_11145 [Marinilabiliales bacterium]